MKQIGSVGWLAAVVVGSAVAVSCGGDVFVTSSDDDGSTSSSASSGSGGATSSSSSGTGGGQVCGQHQGQVIACVQAPEFPWQPTSVTLTGVIGSVGEPAPGCFDNQGADGSNVRVPEWGNDEAAADAIGFTLDMGGGLEPFSVAIATPGLHEALFEPGAPVQVTVVREFNDFGAARGVIEVWRDDWLVAAVMANMSGSIDIIEGSDSCHVQDQVCGYEDRMMIFNLGGSEAFVDKGNSKQLGDGLHVTNDHFVRLYDLGACDFADPVDFTAGATAFFKK